MMNDLCLCLTPSYCCIQTVVWPISPRLKTQSRHDFSSTSVLLFQWNPTSKFCFTSDRTGSTSIFIDLAQLSQRLSTLVAIDLTLSLWCSQVWPFHMIALDHLYICWAWSIFCRKLQSSESHANSVYDLYPQGCVTSSQLHSTRSTLAVRWQTIFPLYTFPVHCSTLSI